MEDQPASPSRDFLALQTALAGRYSLERELGRGGMGIVFLAREVALDRMVALKLLPPDMAANPKLKDRFLNEARTAARLSHPNIVPIFTVDEVGGFVFFAMAFVNGNTLAARVRERGPLSNSEAIRLLREVAWALAHAHLQGIVHRDVKPENIILEEPAGRAMVTDFGIAVLGEDVEEGDPTQVLGTAEFMSPEQAKGGEVDLRSDIYSLGCVGFHALSGRVPFTGPTPAAILGQHLTQPAPRLLSVAPQAPPGVAAAVDRCLRKDPDQRYSGGEALAEALSPETQIDREMPMPLRVFNKQTRDFESTLAWCSLGLFGFGPLFLSALAGGSAVLMAEAAVPVAILLGIPAVKLVRQVRRLLRSGFTLDDAAQALLEDVVRKNEEFRFQVGQRVTWMDRVAGGLKWGGFLGAGLGLVGSFLGASISGQVVGWFFLTGLVGGTLKEIRARGRGDVMGERWLRFLKGRLGKGLFKLSGFKMKRVAPAVSGIHRSTEVAIGLAADRLFEELPKEARNALKGLPETVKALEDDARTMRRQVKDLDGVLVEIGDDDPSHPGAEERARIRSSVKATRDQAGDKLREAVAALETIRLGLLHMHAGSGTVESLTMELQSAEDLSHQMENLLAGHREVERILEGHRKTGLIPSGRRQI